jgi:hypothetical protein
VRSAGTHQEACSDYPAEAVSVPQEAIALEGPSRKRNYPEVEVWVSISSKVSFSLRK